MGVGCNVCLYVVTINHGKYRIPGEEMELNTKHINGVSRR